MLSIDLTALNIIYLPSPKLLTVSNNTALFCCSCLCDTWSEFKCPTMTLRKQTDDHVKKLHLLHYLHRIKWPYKRSIITLSMRFFLVFVSLESFLKQHNGSFHAVFVNNGRSGGLEFIIYLWYIIYTHVYYTHDQAILYSQNCRSSSSSSASRSQMNRLSKNKELGSAFGALLQKQDGESKG